MSRIRRCEAYGAIKQDFGATTHDRDSPYHHGNGGGVGATKDALSWFRT
jgi:hypothetical protein